MKKYILLSLLIFCMPGMSATLTCGGWRIGYSGWIDINSSPDITLAQLRASPYTIRVYVDSALITSNFYRLSHTAGNDVVSINGVSVKVKSVGDGYQTIGGTSFPGFEDPKSIYLTMVTFEPHPWDFEVQGPTSNFKLEVSNRNGMVVQTSTKVIRNKPDSSKGHWVLPDFINLGETVAGGSIMKTYPGPTNDESITGTLDIDYTPINGVKLRLGLGTAMDSNSVLVPSNTQWSIHMDSSNDASPGEYKATVLATLNCN